MRSPHPGERNLVDLAFTESSHPEDTSWAESRPSLPHQPIGQTSLPVMGEVRGRLGNLAPVRFDFLTCYNNTTPLFYLMWHLEDWGEFLA